MWICGKLYGYRVECKVFSVGSKWGIDGGKISKLCIRDGAGRWVVNYDRGWDVKPDGDDVIQVYNEVIRRYN